MRFDDLELVYEELAAAIDAAGEERASLFLSKLALTLAHELGNPKVVIDAIRACLDGLDPQG